MLTLRLSADVGFAGKSTALTKPGNIAAHAVPAQSSANKAITNGLARLFDVDSLGRRALNIAHLLRATSERISELAFISRTKVGEIQAGGTNGRVRVRMCGSSKISFLYSLCFSCITITNINIAIQKNNN